MSKLYAQFDEDGICFAVGTPNITGVEAGYDKIGMKWDGQEWSDPSEEDPSEDIPEEESAEVTENESGTDEG